MTREAVTVKPDVALIDAANLMFDNDLDGLPVVDDSGILVGLVTQSTMVMNKEHIHLPTLLSIMKMFDLYRKDRKAIQGQLAQIDSLKVKDVMNTEPPLLYEGESTERAIMHLSRVHGVNPTSVVTENRKLVGVLTRYDILKSGNSVGTSDRAPESEHKRTKVILDRFLKHFKDNFFFISKWRTRKWIVLNIIFFFIGMIITVAFTIRITIG